jgi:hypothetical protein
MFVSWSRLVVRDPSERGDRVNATIRFLVASHRQESLIVSTDGFQADEPLLFGKDDAFTREYIPLT